MTVFAFIINYNRLTLPSKMADFLADCDGVTPVIVDNNSDYPPLLEYYETTPHKVIRLDFNYGSVCVWHERVRVLDDYGLQGGFIVTDPDLRIDHIPKDWLHVLQTGLDRHEFACKSGFSLRINDLPDTDVAARAKGIEASYWNEPLDGGKYYKAYIDTTFCLCRSRLHDFPAVRAAPPYDAIHVPWYYRSAADVPEDEMYYLHATKARGSTYYTDIILEHLSK